MKNNCQRVVLRKKGGLLFAWIGCLFLLSGCVKAVNLQDRAIVQGVGIDYKGGQYQITMQIFNSSGSDGKTMIDSSKQNAKIITCSGKTVSKAIEQTSISQGKTFFLGHNRLIIMGKSVREMPLEQVLSYFINAIDARNDVNVLLAKKDAAEILKADINQGVLPAMTIEKTIKNADDSGKISEVLLIDVLRSLASKHQSALIPMIAVVDDRIDDKSLKTIELTGMAIFSEGRFQGMLDETETQGMMFLRNEIQKTVFSTESKDFQEISVQIYHSKTKIIPDLSEEQLHFHVQISADGMIQEKILQAGKTFSEESLHRVEIILEEQIRKSCELAFQKAVKKYQSDVFYLGDMVWRDQPELWEKLQKNWKENSSQVVLLYEIHVNIDRTGLAETLSQ